MDWKNLGSKLAEIGLPLLGAALPVPGGAAIGAALAAAIGAKTPEEILEKITSSDEAKLIAQQFQSQHEERILTLLLDAEKADRSADTAELSAVNETMREELRNSANETWYQKGWRPANGFCVAFGSFISVIFTCYLFYLAIIMKDLTALNAVPQLATAIALILAVPGAAVGITAWHRGQKQRSVAEYLKVLK